MSIAKALVKEMFPGKLAIPLVEAGAAIGLARQTCYNLNHKNKFPIQVSNHGGRPVVKITHLIAYLEDQPMPAPQAPALATTPVAPDLPRPTKATRVKKEGAKIGRPKKAEQIARRLAAAERLSRAS